MIVGEGYVAVLMTEWKELNYCSIGLRYLYPTSPPPPPYSRWPVEAHPVGDAGDSGQAAQPEQQKQLALCSVQLEKGVRKQAAFRNKCFISA